MRKTSGLTAFLVVVLLGALAAWYFWRQRQEREAPAAPDTTIAAPPAAPAIVVAPPATVREPEEAPSAGFLACEKEIAALVDKIKAADADHRRLVQEEKKTLPLFDQEINLSPSEITALRRKHAQEQLARKKAIAAASSNLRQLNLELKSKRRELRRL